MSTIPLPNRDNLNELRFINEKQGSGEKFFLPFCQSQVDKHPHLSTKEWLITKSILKDRTAIQAYLKAENYNPQYVVVKLGEKDAIEAEYLRSRLLYTNRLNGFVPYICMFHCNDDKKVYVRKDIEDLIDDGLCGKDGSSALYAIVMPYIDGGNLETSIENGMDFEIVKRVLCDTVLNLREAINRVGFIHRDVHLKNIFAAQDNDGRVRSLLVDYGDSFVISQHYLKTKTPQELFGYNIMVYQDFVSMFDEVAAVYRKKDKMVVNLRALTTWIEDHYKKRQKLDIKSLLSKIMNLLLEDTIPGILVTTKRTPGIKGVEV